LLLLRVGQIKKLRAGAVAENAMAFGLMLVVVQVGDIFVPRSPLSDRLTAIGILIFYTLFAGVAFLVEVSGWTGIVRAREKLRAERRRTMVA
jgi:hypothetical protein